MLRSFSFRSGTNSAPADKEMHEIIRPNSTEEAMDTMRPPELTIVDEQKSQRSECPFIYTLCTPSTTTHRPCRTVHRTLSHLKEKFIPHRAKRTLNSERNRDYVVVDEPGLDHICTAQDLIYQPEAMQVQYSIGPMINHQSCDVAALIDMQSTRSGVECVEEPEEMVENQRDSFLAPSSMSISTGSSTASSTMSSTNSSNNEFSGIDRSILDETEYIRAQQIDLERITMLEITFNRKLRDKRDRYDFTEEEEINWIQSFNEAKRKNTQLREELRLLTEEHERVNLPWSCTSCTFLNEAYSVSHSNVCFMCESPSPLKQKMLMQ